MEPKQKGNLTELQCITAFYELGYSVSIPYGENSRYDFIADIENQLIRVQVKTSSIDQEGNNGVETIKFSTSSTRLNTHGSSREAYTKKQIDFFATSWKGKCYLIPVEECSTAGKRLRFVAPKNGQKVGISFAEDYELQKIIERIKAEH